MQLSSPEPLACSSPAEPWNCSARTGDRCYSATFGFCKPSPLVTPVALSERLDHDNFSSKVAASSLKQRIRDGYVCNQKQGRTYAKIAHEWENRRVPVGTFFASGAS